MSATRLTQRRVDSLQPHRKVRIVRDTERKGFGVRVMPSGAKRCFIHSQNEVSLRCGPPSLFSVM